MPTSSELREQRANVWNTMTEVMARATATGLSAEDTATYDSAEADFDRLGDQVERQERFEALAASNAHVDRTPAAGRPAGTPQASDEDYARVFGSFLRTGILDMATEDRALMQNRFHQDAAIQAAAGVGSGAAGGYTVPPAFRDAIVETMKWYGPMLQEAELITTETGVNLPWPTNDDTANVGAILGENTQVTEQDVTLGTASLDSFMYTSKLVRVSFQLLQERPDFDTWLARKLGERIGRILNMHFTTGTGTSQPDGIVTSSTVGVTGSGSLATTGGVTYDNLIDIVESMDPAYGNANGGMGNGSGLKFMLHQSARKSLRKLKDNTGQPLWVPSLQSGAVDTLLGYPVVLNNDMAPVAVGSKSVLFGNIRQAYVCRIVRELSALRLTERYADFLQVGFLAFERADGTMQDSNAVRVFQTTATA